MLLRINEILGPTIQGEGIYIGCPSMFVRVQGCSLRCPQCDTKQSWGHKGQKTELKAVQDRLQEYPNIDVVITGGEPLDETHIKSITALAQWAHSQQRRVTIETSGQGNQQEAPPQELFDVVALWSVSPKLPAMGFTTVQVNRPFSRMLAWWAYSVQLKFVVSPESLVADLKMIQEYLDIYKLHPADPQIHMIFQVATKLNAKPASARRQILNDWGSLTKTVLKIDWLQKFKLQILPQAHRLIGVD